MDVILKISKHKSKFSFQCTLIYPGAKQRATASNIIIFVCNADSIFIQVNIKF
jgi:hypothetical protein